MDRWAVITCLVCDAEGTRKDVHMNGWRLAKSRIGGYVCGAVCDKVITDFDKAKKDKPTGKHNGT